MDHYAFYLVDEADLPKPKKGASKADQVTALFDFGPAEGASWGMVRTPRSCFEEALELIESATGEKGLAVHVLEGLPPGFKESWPGWGTSARKRSRNAGGGCRSWPQRRRRRSMPTKSPAGPPRSWRALWRKARGGRWGSWCWRADSGQAAAHRIARQGGSVAKTGDGRAPKPSLASTSTSTESIRPRSARWRVC
jgi:hypothetical protein